MGALSANTYTPEKEHGFLSLPVKTSVHIYKGSLVAVDATGYALPAGDTSAHVVMGVAQEEVNNAGASGIVDVLVKTHGRFLFEKGSAAVTDIGDQMYVAYDGTVSASGGSNNVKAGIAVGFVGTTKVWISLNAPEV